MRIFWLALSLCICFFAERAQAQHKQYTYQQIKEIFAPPDTPKKIGERAQLVEAVDTAPKGERERLNGWIRKALRENGVADDSELQPEPSHPIEVVSWSPSAVWFRALIPPIIVFFRLLYFERRSIDTSHYQNLVSTNQSRSQVQDWLIQLENRIIEVAGIHRQVDEQLPQLNRQERRRVRRQLVRRTQQLSREIQRLFSQLTTHLMGIDNHLYPPVDPFPSSGAEREIAQRYSHTNTRPPTIEPGFIDLFMESRRPLSYSSWEVSPGEAQQMFGQYRQSCENAFASIDRSLRRERFRLLRQRLMRIPGLRTALLSGSLMLAHELALNVSLLNLKERLEQMHEEAKQKNNEGVANRVRYLLAVIERGAPANEYNEPYILQSIWHLRSALDAQPPMPKELILE